MTAWNGLMVEESVREVVGDELYNQIMEGWEIRWYPGDRCSICQCTVVGILHEKHERWHHDIELTIRVLRHWAATHQEAHTNSKEKASAAHD